MIGRSVGRSGDLDVMMSGWRGGEKEATIHCANNWRTLRGRGEGFARQLWYASFILTKATLSTANSLPGRGETSRGKSGLRHGIRNEEKRDLQRSSSHRESVPCMAGCHWIDRGKERETARGRRSHHNLLALSGPLCVYLEGGRGGPLIERSLLDPT